MGPLIPSLTQPSPLEDESVHIPERVRIIWPARIRFREDLQGLNGELGPHQFEHVLRLIAQLLPAVLDDVLLALYRLGLSGHLQVVKTTSSATVGMVFPERRASTHVCRCPKVTLTPRARISKSSRWHTMPRGTPLRPACGHPSHPPCESLPPPGRPRAATSLQLRLPRIRHGIARSGRGPAAHNPHSMAIFVGAQGIFGTVHRAWWRA